MRSKTEREGKTLRRVRKFLCLLCCVAMIASTAIDVNAAAISGSLASEAVTDTQAEEGGSENGKPEVQTSAEPQTEENASGEELPDTETSDGAESDGDGEKKGGGAEP